MNASEPQQPGTENGSDRSVGNGDQPVTPLRGGTVNVDVRRAGQWVVGVVLVALVATAIILLVAAIQNNSQIDSLRDHGVPVAVSVTGCLGLMGGTGQQPAGYSCSGTYTLGGVRYHQAIPGLAFHTPGSTIRGIAVPDDPRLLTTPDQLARQHASWTPFIVPGLLLVLVVAVLVLLLVRRSHRSGTPAGD